VELLDIADVATPRPERVSLTSADQEIVPIQGARNNSHPDVSSDGNLVAWVTAAQEVVVGLRNSGGRNQIYVRDRAAGTTTLVTAGGVSPGIGQPALGNSNFPRIADDHRIVFQSVAMNLVSDTTPLLCDIFEYDVSTGSMELLSKRVDNQVQGDGQTVGAAPSDSGRFIAFSSEATNLVSYVPGLTQTGGGHPYMNCPSGLDPQSSRLDVFLLDRGSGFHTSLPVQQWDAGPSITWLSIGNSPNGNCTQVIGQDSTSPDISANGCRVVFQSKANNLVPGVSPSGWQVYVWDRSTLDVDLVSRVPFNPNNPGLFAGDGESLDAAISDDGRWCVFRSNARDVTLNVENEDDYDIFAVDLDSQPYVAIRLDHGVNGVSPQFGRQDPSAGEGGTSAWVQICQGGACHES